MVTGLRSFPDEGVPWSLVPGSFQEGEGTPAWSWLGEGGVGVPCLGPGQGERYPCPKARLGYPSPSLKCTSTLLYPEKWHIHYCPNSEGMGSLPMSVCYTGGGPQSC